MISHVEKASHYDATGTWLVVLDGTVIGTIRPTWPGLYSSRPRWQGYANGIRIGRHHRTRKDAAIAVIDSHQRRTSPDSANRKP